MRKEGRSKISRRILVYMMAVALIPLALLAVYASSQIDEIAADSVQDTRGFIEALGTSHVIPDSAIQDQLAHVVATQRSFRYQTLIGIFVLTALVAGAAMVLSQRITGPISRLTRAAGTLTSGNLRGEIPVEADDEIGELAASLNEMRQAVQAQLEELSALSRVGKIITSTLDLRALLHDMASLLADVVHGTGCFIALLDPDGKRPVPMAAHGDYYDDYRKIALDADEPSALEVAMSTKQPLAIRDVTKSPFVSPAMSHILADKSLLVLPLVVKDRAIGAIFVGDNRGVRDFQPKEVDRAMNMARQVAVAIDNAQLYESAQRHLHDLSLLYQTSAAISTTLDEQTVFDMAIQAFTKVFEASQCHLIVFDDQTWGRLVAEYRPRHFPRSRGLRLPLAGNPLMEWIEENRQPLAIREAGRDPILEDYAEIMDIQGAQSVLVAPLVAKGDVIGTVVLIVDDESRRFTAEEVSLAQTLANQIASVVQNTRLYRQMEEEKRKFELAALNMGEGLIILNREDALLFANPQAQATLGLQGSTALGLPLGTLCPEPELLSLLAKRHASEEGIVVGEMQRGEGQGRDLTISMAPVRNEAGQLQWWVMVIHDISRLKELDRLKSEFVSTVSHELRTPLASIMGFSEMLLTKQPGPLTEIQEEFMGIIFQSSEHLLDLVNDLLDASRMESGRFRLQVQMVDPADLVSRTFMGMQSLARQKSIELATQIVPGLSTIAADPRRIEQVLSNLVHNAIKFTPAGGKVTMIARKNDGDLYFAVTDNGIGIPPQDMDKLFTKFYRSAQVVQGAIGGTGLGLYIAKNIVEAHGGIIGAESRANEGTTFWFTLPIINPTMSALIETEDASADATNSRC